MRQINIRIIAANGSDREYEHQWHRMNREQRPHDHRVKRTAGPDVRESSSHAHLRNVPYGLNEKRNHLWRWVYDLTARALNTHE